MKMNEYDCRKVNKTDRVEKIAEYLHLTDEHIYPTICPDPQDAAWVTYVAQAMDTPRHLFYREHLSVVTCGGEIVGVMCTVPCGVPLTVAVEGDVPSSLEKGLSQTEKGYFLPLIEESATYNGWNVVNVCISPDHRGKGIGKRLMVYCVETYGRQTICLDVIASNTAAVKLYESVGFAVEREYNGFSRDGKPLLCYHMVRRTAF